MKQNRNSEEASTSNSFPSSDATCHKFDVFLSFRGPDTRDKFTSHLYEGLINVGIPVFKDDIEMVKGEGINKALKMAINDSKICIPIFSKNYASSKACLQELFHMVQERKSIIPIFYDVEADDVKLKTDLYRNALEDHHQKGKVEKEEVEKWKKALLEVGKLLGYSIGNKNEANEITTIIRDVLNRLRPRDQDVGRHFVEIDDKVESVIKMLDTNSHGCHIIGLCGLGGIGKTTLAKVVFNRLSAKFDNCCSFLAKVRERVENNKLQELQEQLYEDLIGLRFAGFNGDINHGIKIIKRGLKNKKFLLVLDDMDDENLLEKLVGDHTQLASGSRIIITTRNKRVLEVLEQDPAIYEVQILDEDRALKLFSRCAFRENSPPKQFDSPSRMVVSSLGGLPLALEVVGCSFFGRRWEKAWKELMERLKEKPDKKIQSPLMISYDGLDSDEQKIFLDIACFFGAIRKCEAYYMWEDCGWHPNVSIENLINLSLVKVEVARGPEWGYEWLTMHDVLKDIGRDIARNKCKKKKGRKLERFLRIKENLDAISNEERNCVKMLQIGMEKPTDDEAASITKMDLEGFEKTRILIQLFNCRIKGNLEGLFPKLRWLFIDVADLMATNISLQSVVVLQLGCISEDKGIDKDWWNEMKAPKLKVLELVSYCPSERRTPSFKELSSLEVLTLSACRDLVGIDSSIGELKKLICLRIRDCGSLICLPETIGNATALEEIFLEGNGQRFELPFSIGDLENLSQLRLTNLKMEVIPTSIGNLASLSELDLSDTSINVLPDAIGQLETLRVLRMNRCEIRKFPTTIEGLTALEELEAQGCKNFEGDIPCEISNLSRLRILNLRNTPISRMPKLPSSLTHLQIKSPTQIKIYPSNLDELVNVVTLELGCECPSNVPYDQGPLDFQWIKGASMLEFLYLEVPCGIIGLEMLNGLSWLKELYLHYAEFRDHLQLPPMLSSLCLELCKFSKRILDVSYLKKLRTLIALECDVRVVGLRKLDSLMALELCFCENLKEVLFDGLHSLTVFHIRSCRSLELLHLSNFKSLSALGLVDCMKLVSIKGPDLPVSLKDFAICNCPSLNSLPNLSTLGNLKRLKLRKCEKLKSIEGLPQLKSLEKAYITDCPSLELTAHDISKLMNTGSIWFENCSRLPYTFKDVPSVEKEIGILEVEYPMEDISGYSSSSD